MADPLDVVFAFAEQAYIRLQAGDVLIRCLDEGHSQPMQQLVEGLVLAGPRSLGVLQEILSETELRRSQVQDDLQQVLAEFTKGLQEFGVRVPGLRTPFAILGLAPVRFQIMLIEQGVTSPDAQQACLRLLNDVHQLVESLADHLRLLTEIETFLEDWIWGLAYQSAHSAQADFRLLSPPVWTL